MRATPEAGSGQVPGEGSGQALQGRELKVKNEVGALATSINYDSNRTYIDRFGFKGRPDWSQLPSFLNQTREPGDWRTRG